MFVMMNFILMMKEFVVVLIIVLLGDNIIDAKNVLMGTTSLVMGIVVPQKKIVIMVIKI